MDSALGAQTLSVRPSAPSFSLGVRRSPLSHDEELPGPGSHSIPPTTVTKSALPRVVFGKEERSKTRPPDTAMATVARPRSSMGRQVDGKKRTAPSFTLGGRPSSPLSSEESPGPGTHDADRAYAIAGKSPVKPAPPSYTMRPRTSPVSSKRDNPGPDRYSPSDRFTKRSVPGARITSRPTYDPFRTGGADVDFRGGHSSLGRQVEGRKPSSPSYGFGSGARFSSPTSTSSSPGPAAHGGRGRREKKGWSFGKVRESERPKRGDVDGDLGPASYDVGRVTTSFRRKPRDRGVSLRGRSDPAGSRSYSFGSSPRFGKKSPTDDNPGPGTAYIKRVKS